MSNTPAQIYQIDMDLDINDADNTNNSLRNLQLKDVQNYNELVQLQQAGDSNLQSQLNADKAALEAHKNNIQAHPAQNIPSTAIPGVANVEQGLAYLRAQVNEIAREGSIDPEVAQAHVDVEGFTHDTLKDNNDSWQLRTKKLESEVFTPDYSTSALIVAPVWGLSNAALEAPFREFMLKGRTYTNALGSIGDCEHTDYFSPYNTAIIALDTVNKVRGNASIKITATGASPYIFLYVNDIVKRENAYWLITAYLKAESSMGLAISDNYEYGASTTTSSTTFKRVGVKYNANLISTSSTSRVIVISEIGNVDCIMLNKITSEEYGSGGVAEQSLLDKYPYVNDTTGTNPLEIKSVGLSVFDGHLERGGFSGGAGQKQVSDTTARSINRIRVKPNTTYTIKAIGTFALMSYWEYFGLTDNSIGVINSKSNSDYFTFATGSTTNFINIQLNMSGAVPLDTYVQVVEGISTDIVPYKESIIYTPELNSLPNGVCDTLDGVDGVKIQNVSDWFTLDGSYNWNLRYDLSGCKAVKIDNFAPDGVTNSEYVVNNNGKPLVHANSFTSGDLSELWNGTLSITISDNDSGWGEDYTPTTSDIQAYFNAHPYKIQYQLAEPIISQGESGLMSFTSGTVSYAFRIKFVAKPVNGVITVPQKYQQWGIKAVASCKKIVGAIPSEDATVSNFTATTVTISNADNNAEYMVVYDYENSTIPECTYSYAMNIKAQVETTVNEVNNINKQIDELNDFTVAYLLNLEARLTAHSI